MNVMYVMYLMDNGRIHETSLALSRVGCLGTPAQAWNYTRKKITFSILTTNQQTLLSQKIDKRLIKIVNIVIHSVPRRATLTRGNTKIQR